ncbi:MAG TPA: phosphate ABC transporter ATP-binding protein PstB [Gemmatimonadaceae bacterium]
MTNPEPMPAPVDSMSAPLAAPPAGTGGAAGALKGISTTVRQTQPAAEPGKVVLEVTALNAYFDTQHAVRNVSIAFREREVTAIIGPSGCGKSTLLRCLNRMHETVPRARVTGRIEFHGQDLYGPGINPIEVRRHIGMVFQRPTPFPTLNIRDNVAAGFRVMKRGRRPGRAEIDRRVEEALRGAALWDEVKDRLRTGAIALSGGQQQRLCIARALANEPSIILLDEPTASLDPLSTQKIEELVYALRKRFTVIIVTHNMQQAARVSDRTAFMLNGELVEIAPTGKLFTAPSDPRTEAYVTGRFG